MEGAVPDVGVLVVDDHAVFRDAMSAVVAATDGFVLVGSASSGEDALAAVAALRPDLVLMDVHLPGADGIETSRRLRASGGGPVVVLLSTEGRADVDLTACGATSYLPKDQLAPDRLAAAWSAGSSSSTSPSVPSGPPEPASSRRP